MTNKVVWSRVASIELKEAYIYIKKDSPANAERVRKGILAKSKLLYLQPHRYFLDKDKIKNDGSYRCFVLHRYRISYRVKENHVIILRFRRTSMEPLAY